jgi:hypothetical protein
VTFDDITLRVRTQGGFDTSTSNIAVADVQGWIQERYKALVAESRWRKAEITIGTAVSGDPTYLLPTTVVDLEGLAIAGVPYDPVGVDQLWRLRNNQLALERGSNGVFGLEPLADGTQQVSLYPTPGSDQNGQAIIGLAALFPDPLVSGASPIVPDDSHEALVWGAIATGLATIEERLDSAGYFETQFATAIEKLKRRTNSRVNTGPTQILIKGFHW